MNSAASTRFRLILVQLCCFLTGIAFSAGGGNFPGQEQNAFIHFKALFLVLPVFCLAYLIIFRPNAVVQETLWFIKRNSCLIFYYLFCLIFLFFAVDAEYSFARLSFTIFGFISLSAILIQYFIHRFNDQDLYLVKCINYLSGFSLLFPLYVALFISSPYLNFRYRIESLYLIHPNILAAFYAHFCLWHGIHALISKNQKALHLFYLIIFMFLEYMIFSRAALIALVAVSVLLPFWIACFYKSNKAFLAGVFVIILGSACIVLMMTGILSVSDLAGLFKRDDSLASLMTFTNRTLLWQELLDKITLKVFFTGYGYSVIDKNFGIDLGTGILYGAHNMYLSVLFGSGIISLLSVITWILRSIQRLIEQYSHRDKAIFLSVFSSYLLFFITGMFSEEIGVSFSITFSHLFMITNILLHPKRTAA